jgi:hypothetical protein
MSEQLAKLLEFKRAAIEAGRNEREAQEEAAAKLRWWLRQRQHLAVSTN